MVAGLIGGIATALFQWIVVERQIDKALAIEAANAAPGDAGDEMFTRVQQISGGMLAAVIYGVCLGVVFALAAPCSGPACVVRPPSPDRSSWRSSRTAHGSSCRT